MPATDVYISVASSTVPKVSSHRHLDVIFNDTLTWPDHVTRVITKASAKIGFPRRLSKRLVALVLRELFLCCIGPAIEYARVVWSGLSASDTKRLERCNKSAARLTTRISPSADVYHEHLLARAGIQSLQKRREPAQFMFCCRALAGRLPAHLQSVVSAWLPGRSSHHMTRREHSVRLPRPRKSVYTAFASWNSFPSSLKVAPTRASLTSYFSS